MKNTTPYTFKAVSALNADSAYLVAELDEIIERGGASSKPVRVFRDGRWGGAFVDWNATVVAAREIGANREVVVAGPDGHCWEASGTSQGNSMSEGTVDSAKPGPSVHGAIRDVRVIGSHFYAAGVRRQAYRRDSCHAWTHIDVGTLQPPHTTEIAGFNSIDGLSEDDLYAAGFHGEMWRCENGLWSQLDSPTNVILNKVLAANDKIYICGQKGVLLAGDGKRWSIVATAEEDLWDMAWFNGQLWLAGDSTLFILDEDALTPVEVEFVPKGKKKKARDATVASLSAAGGTLWSVGRKHVLWTQDGQIWTDVTP